MAPVVNALDSLTGVTPVSNALDSAGVPQSWSLKIGTAAHACIFAVANDPGFFGGQWIFMRLPLGCTSKPTNHRRDPAPPLFPTKCLTPRVLT